MYIQNQEIEGANVSTYLRNEDIWSEYKVMNIADRNGKTERNT